MSGIKKLAGQTLWYGIPSILSRFIGYLMNFTLPIFFAQPSSTADVTQLYAAIPFLNVLFTYGLETAYFRFSQDKDKATLYNTLSVSLISSSIMLSLLLYFLKDSIAAALNVKEHSDYVLWMIGIVFLDAVATLAFAKLRQENRPRKYAFVRLAGIVVNFLIVILCAGIIPRYLGSHPDNFLKGLYSNFDRIDFYFIGNICGSMITCLLLFSEFRQVHFKFNAGLWKEVMKYSYPLIIVGLGGMINDMLSRLIYQHVVDLPPIEAKNELGIFGNIYRLAVLITIMIQAFRMAAEPFFFNRSKEADAKKTYARIMKFFVIACCFMFLVIGLYLDVFRWFFTAIHRSRWVEGLAVVPLLAIGNIFLGIYYNLSIWYKLTHKNMYGAFITIAGAGITIALNIVLIPKWHYTGAAVATFCCYLFMMISSYKLGQKYYPVPYAVKKLTAYLVLVILLYLIHMGVNALYSGHLWFSLLTATLLFGWFTWFVGRIEAKELSRMPVIGKFYRKEP
ncbi:MAG: polysaccharide biosynthesis C-terminal domain-containing protein [Ferruginibacter sp.]